MQGYRQLSELTSFTSRAHNMAVNGETNLISREYAADKLTTKQKTKIRKPMVEKMRRDRINSSINQLRNLLEQEFQLLQPDSKPEKADILELAVKFLKQQICSQPQNNKSYQRKDYRDFSQGYSKCLHETLAFLSFHRVEEHMQLKLINHFHCLDTQPTSTPVSSPHSKGPGPLASTKILWRPW
ncbi:hes family bHLH transcription factor 5, gene 3 L homeolog [Xenopus laevis]|uniref:Transcription factor HES-5 n=2 Tax=Xenopus laevis TaxID=8355 RepID=Q90Z13_XENLA|nr:hes family bHLH transcription factor 5, gene 3 L homeolog [Xenopus laevis]AAI69566.1 Enhancer of split related 2 [Xenopus laevis]AAI69568.1 Enhancer of split related 2 [Xenopus laevis]AAK63840.1 enhancer of split related 2 [Xenopus laevis]OCT72803.1 hypothetical protein XELAEV_18035785mg [Xenopus laevis]